MRTADWPRERGRPILGCYLPVGDPAMPADLVALYRDCGVNLLEFGLPCEDPFLDGAVIEMAMARALSAGFNDKSVPERLKQVRSDFGRGAIVVVSYGKINLPRLRDDAGQWLFDAWLDLSLTSINRDRARPRTSKDNDPPVPGFVSYGCSQAEMEAPDASLYVMLQAAPGRTGGIANLGSEVENRIDCLRAAGIRVPILLGIGISTPEVAGQAIRLGADGVIIGSRCVAEALQGACTLRSFLNQVREAIDGAR